MSKGRGFQIFAILALMLFIGFGLSKPEVKPVEDEGEEVTQETGPKYQEKLNLIEPQAYAEPDGIFLGMGSYISIIGKTSSTEYFKEVKRGVLAAGKELNEQLGYEGNKQVKVSYHAPSTYENVDDQVNLLDEELAVYPAAIGISIVDQKACDMQFDLARENNIPIVAFDSGKEYDGIECMITTDNVAAAKECADQLATAMGEKGRVLILAHDSSSETATVRAKAFKKEIKENHKDIKIVHKYTVAELKQKIAEEINEGKYVDDTIEIEDAVEETADDATEEADADEDVPEEEDEDVPEEDVSEEDGEELTADDISDMEMMDYIFEKNPDVTGVYATNAETLTNTIKAVKGFGYTGKMIVGYDINETIINAINDGTIQGTILQNPFGMGYAAVIAAARASLNMGNQAEVDTGYKWVTSENITSREIVDLLY